MGILRTFLIMGNARLITVEPEGVKFLVLRFMPMGVGELRVGLTYIYQNNRLGFRV